MSVGTAGARLPLETSQLRLRLTEVVRAAALMFSAVAFATAQFFSHSMPSPDIVYVPTNVIFYAIGVGILAPAIVLLLIDRAIVANDASGRWVKRYRAAVLAVASVLVLRQLQLYFGPVESMFSAVGPAQGLLFLAGVVGIVVVIVRWYDLVRQFYATAAPLVVLFILITVIQMIQGYKLPSAYGVETPDGSADNPPVFVIVADEFSYDVLLEGDDIDAARYPNLASLASDSAWFTNATTNYVHTTFIVPGFMQATTNVSDDYQLRMYSQYAYVESLIWDECGRTFTCRGAVHLSQSHQPELVGSILRRALFQATPGVVDRELAPLSGWMDGSLRTPPPSVDPLGMHTLTTQGFESFLADVNAETAPGSLYLYHQLLPHTPMVFRADGSIRSEVATDGGSDASWQNYGEQASYFDSLVGRFVARLKAEGIYDEAVIIITGDHGRRPYHIEGHDFAGDAPEVPVIMPHVPLLVHSPAVATGVYDVDYQHKDFEATFMAALGRDVPAGEGVSAFAVERPEREKVFYIDQRNNRYWSYVFNEETQVWDFVEFVDEKLFPDGLAVPPRH